MTLRRRLIVATAAGSAVILCVAGLTLYYAVRASLYSEFDTGLRHKLETLARIVELEDDEIDTEIEEAGMSEFLPGERCEYYQVWSADGRAIYRSPSLEQYDLPSAPQTRHAQATAATWAATLPDGRAGRIAAMNFQPRREHPANGRERAEWFTVALARDTLDVQAALERLRLLLLAVGGAAVVVATGLLAWLVTVGLRPLNDLSAQIAAIDEARLRTDLTAAGAPAELRGVVDRLNDLMQRLAAAFAREKTMTANVAHELRTPLAGLRATLEVALSKQRDESSYRATLEGCLTICTATAAMIDRLLAMGRADAADAGRLTQSVDLAALAHDAWRAQQPSAAQKNITAFWEVPSELRCCGDADGLRLVLANLFDNAVSHGRPGGAVRIAGSHVDGRARLSIANSGCTLPQALLPRVFDRFWRGDPARSSDAGHSGLGLPLCRILVEKMGGSIDAAISDEGWFEVQLNLAGTGLANGTEGIKGNAQMRRSDSGSP